MNKLLAYILSIFASTYKNTYRDHVNWTLKASYEIIPINFSSNRKSYSPAPNSGEDSGKFSSEAGYNFSKTKFHTFTIRQDRVYLVSLTLSITRKCIDVFIKVNQFGVL